MQRSIAARALVTALLGSAAPLLAQVEVGSRVRVTAPAVAARHARDGEGTKRIIGTLLADDGETLALAVKGREAPILVPYEAVQRIDVSRGRQSRARGAVMGAAAGAAMGAAFGVGFGDRGSSRLFSGGDAAIGGALLLAPVGALLGVVMPPDDRWERVKPNVKMGSVSVRRGAGLAVSIAF